MTEKLWTMADLADYLQVSPGTVKHWRHMGYGPPALKLGRHIRYSPAAVQEWQEGQAA